MAAMNTSMNTKVEWLESQVNSAGAFLCQNHLSNTLVLNRFFLRTNLLRSIRSIKLATVACGELVL